MLAGFGYGTACATLVCGAVIITGESAAKHGWLLVLIVPITAVIFGGLPGLVVGTVVGLVRNALRPKIPHAVPVPLDAWSALVDRCAESTRRVTAAVTTVPDSAAKDWMERIAEDLGRELDDVRGIAQLGRALGSVDPQHPVHQRLEAAVRDFAAFENQVAQVALKMFDHPELDQVRTELEFLERQLPQLSG